MLGFHKGEATIVTSSVILELGVIDQEPKPTPLLVVKRVFAPLFININLSATL